jgi:hypothetical protein
MFQLYYRTTENTIQFDSLESLYLLPYLVRFGVRADCQLPWDDAVILEADRLSLFRDLLVEAFSSLARDCYVEPSVESRQKHSSRYQKISLNGKRYVVDYRSSRIGRLMFCLHQRITFWESIISEDGSIELGASGLQLES